HPRDFATSHRRCLAPLPPPKPAPRHNFKNFEFAATAASGGSVCPWSRAQSGPRSTNEGQVIDPSVLLQRTDEEQPRGSYLFIYLLKWWLGVRSGPPIHRAPAAPRPAPVAVEPAERPCGRVRLDLRIWR